MADRITAMTSSHSFDDRKAIELTTRQAESIRMLQTKAAAAQAEVTAYMSAILHGYNVPPDATWGLSNDGTKFVRQG